MMHHFLRSFLLVFALGCTPEKEESQVDTSAVKRIGDICQKALLRPACSIEEEVQVTTDECDGIRRFLTEQEKRRRNVASGSLGSSDYLFRWETYSLGGHCYIMDSNSGRVYEAKHEHFLRGLLLNAEGHLDLKPLAEEGAFVFSP